MRSAHARPFPRQLAPRQLAPRRLASWRRYLTRLGALLALGLLAACDRAPSPAVGAAAEKRTAAAVPQRTTRGDIALRNLGDRIATLEKRSTARGSLALPEREQLADALLTRAQFSGTFSDLTRVSELGEGATRDFPGDAKAWLLRARSESAVHRFDDAARDLERAAQLGANIDARLASLRIAQGRELVAAREHARHRATRAPSLEHLALLASAEAALGEFDAADEHYAAALATLRDVSPFPVAQLCFQRGVMWAELADRPERALPHYLEAVRRLPQYVVANVHLAELEAGSGQVDAAIERLRRIQAQTEDPEPTGYLGELLAAKVPADPDAAPLIERARVAYRALLEQHRTAFLDHAAEFFMGPGHDAGLGSTLAQENLALRQTPRALALAIEAAIAAQDPALACRVMAGAEPARAHSPHLARLLEREAGRCATR